MLSKESHNLLTRLLKIVDIHQMKLNKSSYKWLEILFNKIKSIKKTKIAVSRLVKCSTLNQEQYYESIFIADLIKKDIKSIKDCKIFTILNTTIVIGSNEYNCINMKHIANIISIMRELSGSTDHILINIWNTKHKKFMSPHCTQLEPLNINSGSTLPGEFINLWRHEELYKVLIHELVHTFFFDFRDEINIEEYIRNTFNISFDSPVYIWESYTEFIAIIIHAIYISKNVETVIKIISIEKYFNYLQCGKILNHFGCDSNNQLLNKECMMKYKK